MIHSVEKQCHLFKIRKSLFPMLIILINLATATESEIIRRPHIIFVLADDLVRENIFLFLFLLFLFGAIEFNQRCLFDNVQRGVFLSALIELTVFVCLYVFYMNDVYKFV